MKNIFINIDDNVGKSIFTRQDNNNAEIYKFYFVSNEGRVNLDGKSIKLGYNFAGTDQGDVLNLDITDSENGEVTLPITNKLTKKDGIFYCQFRIYGTNGYLENLVKFTLTVEKTVFSEITEGIEDIKGLTYVEELLEETKMISKKIGDKISKAINQNNLLEGNIIDANSIKNSLESKNTIATENIETLIELNNKAENLVIGLNDVDSLKKELNESIESANEKVVESKTELDSKLNEIRDYIDRFEGIESIPNIYSDILDIKENLKSNQTLGYEGAFVVCENTIESRTKGMIVKGKTVVDGNELMSFGEAEKEGSKYKIIISSRGKNLINENVFEDNIAYYLNGSNLSRSSDKYYKTFSANIEPYKNYYISVNTSSIINVVLFKNGIGMDSFSTPKSKLINGDYDEIKISVLKNRFVNIQLEEGTEATLYQKFKEDKRVILINEPLRSINDFKDIIYEDNGKVKLNRILGEYIFTGDENISKLSEENEETCLFMVSSDLVLNYRVNESGDLICNNFTSYSRENFKNLEGITSVANRFKIRIKKSKLTTQNVEGFKAWLKDNQTKVVYKLPNPITEVVEGVLDIDLDTYINKTYFSILNNYPGTLKFEVQSNIGSLIKNMAEEINNIWGIINNLIVPVLLETNKNIAMAKIKNNLE
ncbi:hypothetical protein ACV3R5_10640 [Clostridium perfringens]|nr:hypothetical protein [Clostridium perfringens]